MSTLGKLIKNRMERVAALPMAQLEVLRFVAEAEHPTMRDVAIHHHIAAPSATALVQELARLGYLTRVADRKDRRQVRLEMTQKGKKALKLTMEKRKQVLTELFSTLTQQDKDTFNRILGNILAAS